MRVAAIILAAGQSSRFKAQKLLVEIGGRHLIDLVCGQVFAAKPAEVIVVTSPEGQSVRAACAAFPCKHVTNASAHDGISTSIRAGIEACSLDISGAAIILGDMPAAAELLPELFKQFAAADSQRIVFPASTQGKQGHPVVWPRRFFSELQNLSGDSGAKSLISKYASDCRPMPIDGPEPFLDVDADADLIAARDYDARRRRT